LYSGEVREEYRLLGYNVIVKMIIKKGLWIVAFSGSGFFNN